MPVQNSVKVEAGYMVARVVVEVEGVTVVVVGCDGGYDTFKTLPPVVTANGKRCGKTGWNSYRNEAYYQSNANIVKVG